MLPEMQVLAAWAVLTFILVREATSLFDQPGHASSGSLALQTLASFPHLLRQLCAGCTGLAGLAASVNAA